MSAGVSDQRMKGQGNQVNSSNKNVESDSRTSIPWSQQVDEAYENLSSPTEGNQSGSYDSSSGAGGTKFQYPPFNAKETGAWSSNKSSSSKRYSTTNNDNYDNEGNKRMYNQQQQSSSYNFFPKNGDYNNTSWAAQVNAAQQQQQQSNSSKRSNNYDDYYNRSERNNHQNDNFKSLQRGMQNMGLENNENRPGTATTRTTNTLSNSSSSSSAAAKAKSATQTATVPKQMTWASIASQPAKPVLRTSSTSTTLKKKGPGMPPPPMVPGKHNMDIGTWDSPKNGPILVPPPPPPVIPVPIIEPSPLSQTKSSSSNSNNNSGNNNSNMNNAIPSSKGDQTSGSQNQKTSRSAGSGNIGNHGDPSSTDAHRSSNQQNVRPPWISQNNPPPKSGGSSSGYMPNQKSNPQHHQGHGGPAGSGEHQRNNAGGDRYHRDVDGDSYRGRGGSGRSGSENPSQLQHSSPYPPVAASPALSNSSSNYPVLEELRDKNNYNPVEIDLEKAAVARFFVIKSYSEDDIHRSIKYEIWCSTEHGNKRLDEAFRERENEGGIVYLFFSVNGSGHFCGMAQMMTPVDYNSVSNVWSQDKWKGKFKVKWIYVKDVPNSQLRHIRLENNDNRSVTHSRDTQEVPNAKGQQVLRIIHSFKHVTSIFDDFFHYEKKQEEEDSKKYETHHYNPTPSYENSSSSGGGGSSGGNGGINNANRGIYRSGDYERNVGISSSDKGYHSGSGGGRGPGGDGGGFRDRNQNRGGGFHSFENRRNDEYRGDRIQRDGPFRDGSRGDGGGRIEGRDIGGRDNRENSGDFHNNRGFHRSGGGTGERNYNNRGDRGDNFNDGNHSGGFMNRGGDNNGSSSGGRSIGGGGAFRDNFNRERDFQKRGQRVGGGNKKVFN